MDPYLHAGLYSSAPIFAFPEETEEEMRSRASLIRLQAVLATQTTNKALEDIAYEARPVRGPAQSAASSGRASRDRRMSSSF